MGKRCAPLECIHPTPKANKFILNHISHHRSLHNSFSLVEPRVNEMTITVDRRCTILFSSCNTSDAVLNGVRIVLRLRFSYHRCEQLSLSKRAVKNAPSVHPKSNITVRQQICDGKNRKRSECCASQHHAPRFVQFFRIS